MATRRVSAPLLAMLLAMLLLASTVASGPAQAAEPPRTIDAPRTIEPWDDTSTPVDDQVLVRYAPGTTRAERRATARDHGLTVLRSGRTTDGAPTDLVVATGRSLATVRRQLQADPDVVAVAPNFRRELTDDITDDITDEPGFANLWGLNNTGQRISGSTTRTGTPDIDIDGLQALRLGLGSSDVVVAVVDDGIDFDHPDLADRGWVNPGEADALAANGIDDDGNGYIDDVHGWDFCNDDASVHDADADGHGTHVAGTIAASLDGRGIVGVAPGISLMALKFIDNGGLCGTDQMAVAAIDYAASFGVRIINASWGGSQPSAVVDAAIADSGALFVAAAGNWGVDIDAPDNPRFYPASSTLPNILAVGAVDQSGGRAGFSNYGKRSVDLGAPGTNILSTYPASSDCAMPCYAWAAGTSMAAPHVTGVAALAASAHPALLADPLRLRRRLLDTGQGLPGGTGWSVTGRMVNAFRAVDTAPPIALAPNRFAAKTGAKVSTTEVPIVVSWPAATDAATSVIDYDLRRAGPTGWTTIAERRATTSASSRVGVGSSYRFRVTARDEPGNTSAAADSPTITASLHPDGSSLARYRSGWRTVASSSALGGKLHTTSRAGTSVRIAFTGRSFALVSTRGPSRGKIEVWVDGALARTVDLRRASTQSRVVVFSTAWTTKAAHSVRIVVVGSKRVDIDGFVVVR
ncbi:MAG: S8 family peptidase [Candidatus Limnocylindrales bacterium]